MCFYPFFYLSEKPKTILTFLESCWRGKEKYFGFLFIASCTLHFEHAKSNRLLQRNVLTCYPVHL